MQVPPPSRPPGACHLSPKLPPLDPLLMVCGEGWFSTLLLITKYSKPTHMCHWHIYSQYRKPKPAQCSQLKESCVKYLCQERNQNDQSPKHSIERKSQILQRKVVKSTFPGWKVFNTRFRGHRAGGKVRSPKEERPQNLFSPALTVPGVDRTGEGKGTCSHLHSSHPSPVTRTPHSHSITPCSHSQP